MRAGLDTRPSATTYDVEELVTQAWKGAIRVPHFQRDLRWGRQDVVRLFDSIVKGYPVGSLLLWVRPGPKQSVRLGALTIKAPHIPRAFWVVDGQQRITSLANALHEEGCAQPRFSLAYDLREGNFVPRPGQENPWLIPLPVLFDLQRLIRWFASHQEIGDHLDQATGVTKTIRQFEIPAYQVEQGDETVLRDIFDRMNNYGKRLSRAEVFSALYAGDEATKDSRLDISLIADHINDELSFGLIDDDTLLHAILARRGPDITREIRNEFDDQGRRETEFPGEDRDTAYEAGEEALRKAVTFLKDEAGVAHYSLLAYRYLLVVLARFFAHHPHPDQRNLRLLRRWYWRAALAGPGVFKGSVTGAMRVLC